MGTNQEMKKSIPNNAHRTQIGAIEIDFGGPDFAPQIQVQKPIQDEVLLDPTELQQQIRGLSNSDEKGRNLEFGAPGQKVTARTHKFLDRNTGEFVTQSGLIALKELTGCKRKQTPLNLVNPPIQPQYVPEITASSWAQKNRAKYNASSIGSDGRKKMQEREDEHGDMVPDPPRRYKVGVDADAVVVESQKRIERDGQGQGAEFTQNGCDAAKMWRVHEKQREKDEKAANKERYANLADLDEDD